MNDINLIAFASGPGLPPCLLVGKKFVEKLVSKTKAISLGVQHGIGHIELAKFLTGAKDFVVTFLSGGHTSVLAHIGGRFRTLGETEDISVGSALDKFGRAVGLDHPGGPKIERLAKKGKNFIQLPYVVKGIDLSFSGIVTQATKLYKQGHQLEDLCYSLQEVCFSMITEVTERAMAHTGKAECLLTGGVAANKRLREMLDIMCKERNAKLFVVPLEYSGDCGAQIAVAGLKAYKYGHANKFLDINSKWRIDEVPWPD